jgi:hypothetical protein
MVISFPEPGRGTAPLDPAISDFVFVEGGVFAFLGHKLDIQIMFVFFLDVFDCVLNVHGNSL